MFTSPKPSSVINTVTLVEGNFKIDPSTNTAKVDLLLMYSNQKSGITFGTCPAKESLLRPETIKAFKEFSKQVEKDFAELILEGGIYTETHEEIGNLAKAESNEGLKPKGIGGY